MKHIILISMCIFVSKSVKLPSNFQKCNRNVPNWKECVFAATIDGVSQLTKPFKEVNIPNLEPLLLPEISISTGTSAIQVNQHCQNCKIFGLTKLKADVFEFDFDKKKIFFEGTFPEVRISGEYRLDGKVLLLPIIGQGPGEIKLSNLYVKNELNFEEVKKKGRTYIKIVSADLKMQPGLLYIRLDNLFNGDKVLGDNLNRVLNDNWQVVYEDLKDGCVELVKKIFISLLNGFYGKVSIEEAFD